MAANSQLVVTCVNTAGGTGTASWTWVYTPIQATLPLTNPMTTGGDIIYGGASGVPTRLANGSAGQVLISAGGTSAPAWGTDQLGVATNSSASAGYKGEYIESVISAQTNFPAGNSVWGDATSMSLTAGDWEVSAVLNTTINTAVTWTQTMFGISTTTGNSATGLVDGSNRISILVPTATTNSGGSIAGYRMLLSGTTTVYFKLQAVFSSGSPQFTGCRLSARRMR